MIYIWLVVLTLALIYVIYQIFTLMDCIEQIQEVVIDDMTEHNKYLKENIEALNENLKLLEEIKREVNK